MLAPILTFDAHSYCRVYCRAIVASIPGSISGVAPSRLRCTYGVSGRCERFLSLVFSFGVFSFGGFCLVLCFLD